MTDAMLLTIGMSASASIYILFLICIRILMKNLPKWFMCILWGILALRLICPLTFESSLGLFSGNTETYSYKVNEFLSSYSVTRYSSIGLNENTTGSSLVYIACGIWIIGLAFFLSLAVLDYLKLNKKLSASILINKDIYECDEIEVPFVIGIFHPTIYLPSSLPERSKTDVILHETTHIKRGDYFWKPIGYLILCIHWFNPLCWIAYALFCKDLELACDERVIRDMGRFDRAEYAQSLLDVGHIRQTIRCFTVEFGELSIKERIQRIMKYQKSCNFVKLSMIFICSIVTVCLVFTAKKEDIQIDNTKKELVGIVTNTDGDYMTVKPNVGSREWMISREYKISISNLNVNAKPMKGDKVKIIYNGKIEKSSVLDKVYGIYISRISGQ